MYLSIQTITLLPLTHNINRLFMSIHYSSLAWEELGDVSPHPEVWTEGPSVRHHWLPGRLGQTHHQKTQWHWEGCAVHATTGRGVEEMSFSTIIDRKPRRVSHKKSSMHMQQGCRKNETITIAHAYWRQICKLHLVMLIGICRLQLANII